MKLSRISFNKFRNYDKREYGLANKTVIEGGNGVGKSNIIEAIYLLATGRSFRADRDSEMISWGEHVAVVDGVYEDGDLRITLTDGSVGAGYKLYSINGVKKRMSDFVGQIRAVLFGPADIELVTGTPSVRRKYLDMVISQADYEYRRNLMAYEKGLRQRNKLLDLIRDGQATRNQLFFWDRVLIKNGEYITQKREEFLEKVGFTYDKSIISEVRLKQYENEEVMAGSTLVGPHRDDFVLEYKSEKDGGLMKDVSKYGSRGEQRMAVWWLKQCEIKYLGGDPILLLDDIFSELDHKHREEVSLMVEKYAGQVIMTTADEHMIPRNFEWDIIRI